MRNAFTKEFGTRQGRIARLGAPEGLFVYELGHSLRADAVVKVGDYHEISQSFVAEPLTKTIRLTVTVETPVILPVGRSWELSARLNGVIAVSRRLRPSKRTLVLSDWCIDLSDANPNPASNLIAFRLELV